MPRIRTIKPEFWGDEKLAPMRAIDRLVFLGLISLADDAGRLLDSVRAVDGFVFPESDDSASESLDRLAQNGRITRYVSASGQRLIQITNWKRHQQIQHPSKYTLPGQSRVVSGEAHESLTKSSRLDQRPATSDLRPTTNERSDQRPATTTPTPAEAITFADLPADVVEFGATYYGRAPADRRRKIANQLLRLARGLDVRFKKALVSAGSLERLARKCRDVLDGSDVRDHDKAIAVLLTKLADSTDLTDGARQRDEAQRADENQRTADEMQLAEAWLFDHPGVEASIDEELIRQGYPNNPTGDAILSMTRTWVRRGLVLQAWRAGRAPDPSRRASA